MTVYGQRGQVVHHKNCTYCTHRMNVPFDKKGKRKGEMELCGLTRVPLPAPPDPLGRYCENYVQVGCECEACRIVTVMIQSIDKCSVPC